MPSSFRGTPRERRSSCHHMPARCNNKVTARKQQLVVQRCANDGRVISPSSSVHVSSTFHFSSFSFSTAATTTAVALVQVSVIGSGVEPAPSASVASD